MSKPSILFLNRSYWPDSEATGQLLTELCQYLAPRWDVHVAAGKPNSNPTNERVAPNGASRHHGVTIHRLPHTQFQKRNRWGRLTNLATFTYSVHRWMRRQAPNVDLLVSETDPFFLPIVAAQWKRRTNKKWIAYLQDIYPDIAEALQQVRNRTIIEQVRKRLRRAYQLADQIIVLSEDMKQRLEGWGIESNRMHIVPNWVDVEAIRPMKQENAFRTSQRWDERFVVMHSGNMGLSQQLATLIDATEESSFPSTAIVALVGGGAQRPMLERKIAALDSRPMTGSTASRSTARTIVLDYQPKSMLAESLSAADLHVISMDQNITGCLAPSKLYGILASGTPILAIVPPETEVARLVAKHQLGYVVAPGNPKAIADAIAQAYQARDALQAMGQRGRDLAIANYDRIRCCDQFESVVAMTLGLPRDATSPDHSTFTHCATG
jgi:colanic acid biosynthesis glycosyl transferase WcaI